MIIIIDLSADLWLPKKWKADLVRKTYCDFPNRSSFLHPPSSTLRPPPSPCNQRIIDIWRREFDEWIFRNFPDHAHVEERERERKREKREKRVREKRSFIFWLSTAIEPRWYFQQRFVSQLFIASKLLLTKKIGTSFPYHALVWNIYICVYKTR